LAHSSPTDGRRNGQGWLADIVQSPAPSVREDGIPTGQQRLFRLSDGLLRPRVPALRLPAAGSRRIRRDLHRFPADAAWRKLQSRDGQGRIEAQIAAMKGKMG